MFGTRLVAQAAFAVVAPEPSSLAAILSLREATRRSNLEFHRHQKIRLLRRVAPRNDENKGGGFLLRAKDRLTHRDLTFP